MSNERLNRLRKKGFISDDSLRKKDAELAEKIRKQRQSDIDKIKNDLNSLRGLLW